MTKPIEPNVLVAKLGAILRRTYELDTRAVSCLQHRGMCLYMDEMRLTYENKSIELSKNEFRILRQLLESKGKVVSRNEMMKALWDDEIYVNENTLTVNVNRLRGRLDSFNRDSTSRYGHLILEI